MAYTSPTTFTGDGIQTVFSFSFPYLEDEDVHIEVDGAVIDQGAAADEYQLLTAGQATFGTAPADQSAIEIHRRTVGTPDITFSNPGINPDNLNRAVLQALYLGEEARERALHAEAAADAFGLSRERLITSGSALVNSSSDTNITANSIITAPADGFVQVTMNPIFALPGQGDDVNVRFRVHAGTAGNVSDPAVATVFQWNSQDNILAILGDLPWSAVTAVSKDDKISVSVSRVFGLLEPSLTASPIHVRFFEEKLS